MGPKFHHKCPWKKEVEDLIHRGMRRECGDRGKSGERETASQGPPRNVNSHQKLEEARDVFSLRISAGNMTLLIP